MRPPSHPLQHFALEYTASRLSREKSAEAVAATLKKLHARAAQGAPQGDPTAPCLPCGIGNAPVAIASELLPIQSLLASMPEEARDALRAKAAVYKAQTMPYRNGRLREGKFDCPFYSETEGCRIQGARPFGCLLTGDPNAANDTRALAVGHMFGLAKSGLDHTQIELGLAIPALLDEGDLAERYVRGEAVAWEGALIPPGRDGILEETRAETGQKEATGFPVDLPTVAQAQQSIRDGEFDRALSHLRGRSPLEQLYRLQVPYVCESEDEISERQDNLLETLREVAQMRFEPSEAFDALKALTMYSLPFQGRDVRPILTEIADTLTEPIAARALPDLTRPIEGPRKPGKVRVGYLSRNIKSNNGSLWALGWIRHHGPDIESYVFATTDVEDEANIRFREAADHYYHVPGDVPTTARFIKSLDLDVLIFTDIGQVSWNTMYAALRLARVQCTAWGFPVTSGLSTIDFYLSSELMEPENCQEHYREKLVRLPGSGLYLDPPAPQKTTKTRAEFGLPAGPLIGMLQNVIKCVPKWDSLFAQIQEKTGAKVILAEHYYPGITAKMKKRFAKAGVEVEWLPRSASGEFFQMVQCFDVLIDTPAWSGGITTLDTLPYGVPVVTLPGEFMRGRLSHAFLSQANLSGLIAKNPTDFLEIVASPERQSAAMSQADLEGPYRDVQAVKGVNEWLSSVVEPL